MGRSLRADKRVKAFIAYVREECKKAGVKFNLTNGYRVNCGGVMCAGCFGQDRKGKYELRVAGQHHLWFDTLIHEFAHFLQWRDRSPIWIKAEKDDLLFDWVLHECELTKRQLDAAFRRARDLELDAERRAVQLIKRFDLPIDVDLYTKRANSYVYFYAYLRVHRKWCSKTSPYNIPSIVAKMPNRFLRAHQYDRTPDGFDALCERYCVAA